jgi:hypothetical protein
MAAGGVAVVLLGGVLAARLRRVRAATVVSVPSTTPLQADARPAASSDVSVSAGPASAVAGVSSATAPPASAASVTVAALRKFDGAAAQAELETFVPELVACKLASGTSYRVKLTFTPDGHVGSAAALGRLAGTAPGVCIATHLKKARVAPFVGRPTPYLFTFVAKAK